MEVRLLKYFLTVAREQSITKAAELLHITQPTLSRQIMDLENEIGKDLFVRGNRKILAANGKISLTEEGVLLRKRAEDIIELIEKTERELRNADNEVSGTVYLSCGETHIMELVVDFMRHLRGDYHNITF